MHKLFVYNPTCEMAVQNGSVSYQPPLRLQTFESDMADIMLWLSQTDLMTDLLTFGAALASQCPLLLQNKKDLQPNTPQHINFRHGETALPQVIIMATNLILTQKSTNNYFHE